MGRIIIVYEHERSSNIRLLHASNAQNKNEKKMKENETKRCASQKIWHVELMKNENKYGYSVCIIVLFVCLNVLRSFCITWTVLSFLIWYAFTQFSRQTTIIQKKHIEKKRLLKFQKSCYNQVFYVVHLDSLEKIIYFSKLFK